MIPSYEFSTDGKVTLRNQAVGYIVDDAVYRDSNRRDRVGYISGSGIYSGGSGSQSNLFGGQLVGYVERNTLFGGGNGSGGNFYNGRRICDISGAHQVWQAAAYLLLT